MNSFRSSLWQRIIWIEDHRRLVAAASVIGVTLTTIGLLALFGAKPAADPAPTKTVVAPPAPAPKPVLKTSALTGAVVDPQSLADRPITGVIIENHTDARPQSGLGQAGVVYEALAEGGITRFLAFFQDNRPAVLGPVRSLRTYFLSWGLEFDASIAHAGGNADALDLVGPMKLKDMNQFSYGDSFYRTNDRYSPHNLYTTSDLLDRLEARLSDDHPSVFTPSPRKADSPTAGTGASVIDLDYSYNGYQVEYRYDTGCNCYARFLAGAPHIDRNDGVQIHVKNVVVEYMPTAFGTTRIGEQTVRMGDSGMPIGSNKAIVFRDGTATVGTWNRPNESDRTKLLDAAGKEIPLDVGNTWYSIIPTNKTASYK